MRDTSDQFLTSASGQTFNSNNQNSASAYAFDGNGNPTTYKSTSLTFDAENRLTGYGSVMAAGYTGTSMRAWKETSSGTTYFLYEGAKSVCELNSSGAVTATNTWGPGGLISRNTSSGSIFYAFDIHGNVAQRLNGSGTVISSQMFDAFGNRVSTDSNTDPYAGFEGQYGYYTDYETGLELMTFRYYDPSSGRFLTRDPVEFRGGINFYEYGDNNPILKSDPLGLAPNQVNPLSSILNCIAQVIAVLAGNTTASPLTKDEACEDGADCLASAIILLFDLYISVASGGAGSIWLMSPEGQCIMDAADEIVSSTFSDVCEILANPCEQPDFQCAFGLTFINAFAGCLEGLLSGGIPPIFGSILANAAENFLEQIMGNAENQLCSVVSG